MKKFMQDAIQKELGTLKTQLSHQPVDESQMYGKKSSWVRAEFVNKTGDLINYLIDSPQTTAQVVSEKFGMDEDEIKLAYKIIQRSATIADYFKASYNGDYLNVVNHYFSNQMFVIVFFVGLACPSRCVFCPNITVNEDGSRDLVTYTGKSKNRLNAQSIERIFEDIKQMKKKGISVLVKISGGLEPFTDLQTMSSIIDHAKEAGVMVKLFTNGLLLDNEERREIALKAGDVRISLNIINETQYEDVLFGSDMSLRQKYSFKNLMTNMKHLVKESRSKGYDAKIGLNSIILEQNHQDIKGFVNLAEDLGVDYIDFKPNYFTPYQKETGAIIESTIDELKKKKKKGDQYPAGPRIYFANSLSGKNVFWKYKSGYCKPHKQARFKLFITPFGVCTPVHHGAFPTPEEDRFGQTNIYSGGTISSEQSLLDILGAMPELPDLEYSKLNPFEFMLSLEIEREERDAAWGIPSEYNPYNFAMGSMISPDLRENKVLKKI